MFMNDEYYRDIIKNMREGLARHRAENDNLRAEFGELTKLHVRDSKITKDLLTENTQLKQELTLEKQTCTDLLLQNKQLKQRVERWEKIGKSTKRYLDKYLGPPFDIGAGNFRQHIIDEITRELEPNTNSE